MTAPSPSSSRWPFRIVGLVAFVALVLVGVTHTYPPLPAELTLEINFPDGNPARTEPLVSAGTYGNADFLVVNYLDKNSATFSYDYWGFGGPTSERFTFTPGTRHTLRLALPAFAATPDSPRAPKAPLRIEFDGRELLKTEVAFHTRAGSQIFFGENPVGGTTAGGFFRGEIYASGGRELRGRPAELFSWISRFGSWLASRPGELVGSALLGWLAAWLAKALTLGAARLLSAARGAPAVVHTRPPHAWFVGTAMLCGVLFAYVVSGGTFRLIYPEIFGDFYDYQAASLLAGHLDVPAAALNGEAFVFGGKYYGYFGPTPALLRIPFVLFGVGFGELSRSLLLVYYLVSLGGVYALLVQATRWLTGRDSRPARLDVVLLVASAGLGSSLFYLSSRAYVYHEAILCGAMFALWSIWYTLRWIAQPESRTWLTALALGILSVHARPPVGLFALSLVGCAAAALLWQRRADGLRAWLRPVRIGLLSVLGVLSFNGLSYLKFRSFEGAPLKYHVQYHPERLAHIQSKNFHASNFRYNFDSYVWRPNFRLLPTFPYFFIEGRNPNEYRGTRIDLAEPTLGLPYTMPVIVFFTVIGGTVALVRWPPARRPLALLGCAVLPMALALFTAVAVSQRYTVDFGPALFAAAAFGLAAASSLPRGARVAFRTTAVILALGAFIVTAATTLSYQGDGVWGVPDEVKARYQSWRQSADHFFGTKTTP